MMMSISGTELVESVLLGVALAMDAMAVTISNTLCEPDMPSGKKYAMPVAFALFQFFMPVAGFFGGTLIASYIERYAGVVSFVILACVGGKMAWEALHDLHEPGTLERAALTYPSIFLEAVATSIDAFIVGVSFAAEGKDFLLYSSMIGVTTCLCCLVALALGRRLGEHFGSHAQIVGAIVLILIGCKALFA